MIKYYSLLFAILLTLISPSEPIKCDEEESENEAVRLDDIVISATRAPASMGDISASSSTLPEKRIKSSTAMDLGHLLESTNMVGISDYGPGSMSMASIRGSSAEQVLVLVDGERINNSRSGAVDLSIVPLSNAKRIEVIRGGQSAMYGADAVGGIINIITKQPSDTKAQVWSTLGAYDSLSWGADVSKRVKTISGLLSLSKSDAQSDFPFEDKNGRELIRENADSANRNILGKLKWDISDSIKLRLAGNHYYSDRGDPGPIGQYSPEAIKRDKSNSLSANLEHSVWENFSYKISADKRKNFLRYINPKDPYPIDDTHETDATGAELQFHLWSVSSTPIIWGVSFRNEEVSSTALGDQVRETYSAYIQQESSRNFDGNLLKLNRILFFPAIRWDNYSDFKAGISPKLGFLASFGENYPLNIRANIGRSYRAPSMNDLYWPPDAFASGNPDLKPEEAYNLDIGAHFYLSKPPMKLGITYFWNSFKDRIQWTPGAEGKWSPQNLSEATSSGIETEAQWNLSLWNIKDLLSFNTNYTFLKTEDMLKRQLIYRPSHSIGYTLRVDTGKYWLQFQGSYLSRRYYTLQNTKWLEPFMKHDIQIGSERGIWYLADVGIIFEIRNIFNKRYQLVADYPLPGREWRVKTYIGMKGE
jgi:outer membrane cobalamin receptor